mgnify:CR=1 FL=1
MEGSLFNPSFLGGNFLWWIGQVADDSTWRENINEAKFKDPKKETPGWGYRYKVRILGLHDEEESTIESDQLPWAQVMYPVTAGGGQQGKFTTPAINQGNFVFGFFLDGPDQQSPVIMGILGNNGSTKLETKTGASGGKNFTPQSGFSNNKKKDKTKKVSDSEVRTQTPESNSFPTKENSDAIHQETVEDKKTGDVLTKKHALACPDPEKNSDMKGIQTVIENLSKKIEQIQKNQQFYDAAASLPVVDAGKNVEDLMGEASGEISKYMKGIMGRVQDYTTDEFNKQLLPVLKISNPGERNRLLATSIDGLDKIACLFNNIAKGLPSLILGALLNFFNNRKNQIGDDDDSSLVPPIPPEGFYAPTPICSVEELTGEVLGQTINEIMNEFDNAIGPVLLQATNSSNSNFGKNLLGSLGGFGALGGLKFDIAKSVGFISAVSELFVCDPKPKCSPHDTHTLQSGGSGKPSFKQPSLASLASAATKVTNAGAGIDQNKIKNAIAKGNNFIKPTIDRLV